MNDQIVPLFCTAQLDATKSFYQRHLGFRVAVEMPGYAELERGSGGPKLGFMSPEEGKWKPASGEGLLYCFSVENADREHERLVAEGVSILAEPEDKPWGLRSCCTRDPEGYAVWISTPVEGFDA